MKFTLFLADTCGSAANCLYPHRVSVTDEQSLAEALQHDYVAAHYFNDRRSCAGFLGSDCLPLDCDNDHSEQPADWVTPEDVAAAFPEAAFAVHYSRHHNKEKNGLAARPKFHVFFPIGVIKDADVYAALKQQVHARFPQFDKNALDAARFFFGTPAPQVEWHEGSCTVDEFLRAQGQPAGSAPAAGCGSSAAGCGSSAAGYGSSAAAEQTRGRTEKPHGGWQAELPQEIPAGRRNSELHRNAVRFLLCCGDTPEALERFHALAERCNPPLPQAELDTIWRSAQSFHTRVRTEDEARLQAAMDEIGPASLLYFPEDLSDVGEARQLARHFSNRLRYSDATGFLCYRNGVWVEDRSGAHAVMHELTALQLEEAEHNCSRAQALLSSMGMTHVPKNRADELQSGREAACAEMNLAVAYRRFVLQMRSSSRVNAVLTESRSMLSVRTQQLDADCFLLCTPSATYDLRLGLAGARPHDPNDLLTRQTSVNPGDRGAKLWREFLQRIFCGDEALIEYVQLICGLVIIGKVLWEALIIAFGYGRNGKSTFWNTVARVLGSYSGCLSADVLNASTYRNVKPELAEARGKRLLIAAEMQEGARLNDSIVKQLCSTDDIYAEKKYKDPFSYTPTHSLVLYTNHLPRANSNDEGLWRRMHLIPFTAVIEGNDDIKNYSDYLYTNAGESVLAWLIEGARRVIALDYRFTPPECVQQAQEEYRMQNDWLQNFLDECCDVGPDRKEGGQVLFKAYRQYVAETGEYPRTVQAFSDALLRRGFIKTETHGRRFYNGLRLKPADGDFARALS